MGNTRPFTLYPKIYLGFYPMFQPSWTSTWFPQEFLLPLKDPAQMPLPLWSLPRFPIGFLPVCSDNVSVRAWQEESKEIDGTATWVIWGYFLKWAVTGQQMQAAHCERSWGSQYFTSYLSLCLMCCQSPHWLNPTRSQRAKEPIDTVNMDQPPQGKELCGEGLRVTMKAGWTKDIRLYLHLITFYCYDLFPWVLSHWTLTLPSLSPSFLQLAKDMGHSSLLLISAYWINELIKEWQRWKHQEHNKCS